MLRLVELSLDLTAGPLDSHEHDKLLDVHFFLLLKVIKHLPEPCLVSVAFRSTIAPVLLLIQDLHERDSILQCDIALFKDGVEELTRANFEFVARGKLAVAKSCIADAQRLHVKHELFVAHFAERAQLRSESDLRIH